MIDDWVIHSILYCLSKESTADSKFLTKRENGVVTIDLHIVTLRQESQ